tara:strand:+ start:441 stop:650 length:210 start_codon:yes stop_codon:yes gene_type:complete
MECLDCKNIIEINAIRQILKIKPQLLKVFDDIIKVANIRLNDERQCVSMPIEVNTEPELSDHSSDEGDP